MGGGVQDLQDALLVDHGGEHDRNVVERGQTGLQGLGVVAHGVGLLLEEVPLVHHDNAALAVLLDDVEDVHVLRLHPEGGVDHEDAHVGMLDGAHRPEDGIEFQVLGDLGLAAHAGGVHQDELVAELVVIGGDGVAGGPGDGGDDVALLTQQGVGHGGLAHVRPAHDGDMREVGMVVLGRRILGQHADDLVQEVAGARAVGGGDAPHLAEAQAVEVVSVVHLLARIHLVHAKDDGLLAAAQQVRDFRIVVGDAGGGLAHEQDHVGLLHGDDHLHLP